MHDLTEPWQIALLVVVGAAAGFVNTAAGAGSLLSLRALMLLGVPATIANATNRLPVLAQSVAAGIGFHAGGKLDRENILRAAIPSSVGSLVGALAASYAPEKAMRYILIVALFGMAVVSLVPLKKPAPTKTERIAAHTASASAPVASAPAAPNLRSPAAIAWLLIAGAYGGFLQAGVGLVLLFALSNVGGYDLVRANALKVVVVGLFTVVSLAVFVARGEVWYGPGLVMCGGSVVGARFAVRFAMNRGAALKRLVVLVDLVACAALVYREFAE